DPENHIAGGPGGVEIRLLDGTLGEVVGAAGDDEEIMHPAIRAAIRVAQKPRFADRPGTGDEIGQGVVRALPDGDLRIRDGARAPYGRLRVAVATPRSVKPRPQAVADAFRRVEAGLAFLEKLAFLDA